MEPIKSEMTTLSEINVTPFVDVMLVLLIIFMVTAPMLFQGVDVDLPQADAKNNIDLIKEEMVLSITKDKKIFLNKEPLTTDELPGRLTRLASVLKGESLYMRSDKDVPYGFVVKVMAMARSAGITKLGMVTEEEEQEGYSK